MREKVHCSYRFYQICNCINCNSLVKIFHYLMVLPKHTRYHSLATMLLETISMVSSMIYSLFRNGFAFMNLERVNCQSCLLKSHFSCSGCLVWKMVPKRLEHERFTVWLSRGLLLLVCIIILAFVQEISIWQLLLDDLLKNSATNFENEEDLSLSNWAGESYSTTLPVLSKISALISSNRSQLNLIYICHILYNKSWI